MNFDEYDPLSRGSMNVIVPFFAFRSVSFFIFVKIEKILNCVYYKYILINNSEEVVGPNKTFFNMNGISSDEQSYRVQQYELSIDFSNVFYHLI